MFSETEKKIIATACKTQEKSLPLSLLITRCMLNFIIVISLCDEVIFYKV